MSSDLLFTISCVLAGASVAVMLAHVFGLAASARLAVGVGFVAAMTFFTAHKIAGYERQALRDNAPPVVVIKPKYGSAY